MTAAASDTLLLTVIASVLAILWEFFNPITKEYLERQAREVVHDEGLTVAPDVLRSFASGAVSVCGLAPTVLTVLMAAISVIHDRSKPFWWLAGATLALAFMLLLLLRGLSRRNLYAVGTRHVVVFSKLLPFTYAELNSIAVYVMNVLVIALCAYFYWYA
jgi:uncharacterized BrkB/YihY/UPF0761 family membrane protein